MANLAEQASKLLDFDQKLDITLLDSIVGCMYSGAGEQVTRSQLYDFFITKNNWVIYSIFYSTSLGISTH